MKKISKKGRSKHNESIMTKVKNWAISLSLAGLMLFGLQCYSNTTGLKFAQVSDVHYYTGESNTTYKVRASSPQLLDDAIEQINSTPNIAFTMFTGDLIDVPYEKELQAFLPHTQKIKAPWYFTFGNHDTMIGGLLSPSVYIDNVKKYNKNFTFDKTYYSFSPKNGYKVIVLDPIIRTKITGKGLIGKEQLAWLDNEIATAKNDTILIFLHIPVIEPYHSPSHRLEDADNVEEILNKYKNPIGVFQGHYHGAKITKKGNVVYVSCPALVSYPNAFRIITVTNYKNRTVFEIKNQETRLTDIQSLAKLLVFAKSVYEGQESDRNATITINKGAKNGI